MLAAAEHCSAGTRAGWIERDTKHVDAARSQTKHGAPCVLDQIARIDHVDIGWLTVREDEGQFAMAAHSRNLRTGVPQSRSESRRQVRFEMRQPRLDVRAIGLGKFLQTKQTDI